MLEDMKVKVDWEARLLELARKQQQAEDRTAVALKMRQQFYDLFVKPYDDEIAELKKAAADTEAAIVADMRAYALETGDHAACERITVKHKPDAWEYDDKAVLERVTEEILLCEMEGSTKAAGELQKLVRVKRELNKIELNKMLAVKKPSWLPITKKPADVTVSIGKLGDLLIIADLKAQLGK